MGGTIGVTIRLQRVAKADQAHLDLILVHQAHRHRVRVVNHAVVVAVLDQHRSQGRVDQDPVAITLQVNQERADHRPIVFEHRRERHCW